MPVQIPTYDVLIKAPTEENPDATIEHRVQILNADQLRAELEAGQNGLTDIAATPLHYTALWMWAALTRERHITAKWREFKPLLLAYEAVKTIKNDQGEEEFPAVDPTQPAAVIGSHSASLPTGPASTGSAPTTD